MGTTVSLRRGSGQALLGLTEEAKQKLFGFAIYSFLVGFALLLSGIIPSGPAKEVHPELAVLGFVLMAIPMAVSRFVDRWNCTTGLVPSDEGTGNTVFDRYVSDQVAQLERDEIDFADFQGRQAMLRDREEFAHWLDERDLRPVACRSSRHKRARRAKCLPKQF